MGFVGYVIIAGLAAGGGILGGLVAMKLRLDESMPQAVWFSRVAGGWIWAQIAKRLWARVAAALQQPP